MVPLVLAAMFLGLVTTASGQRRGQPLPPGGYGNIFRPATGHTPTTPAGWHNLFGRPVPAARPNAASPGQTIILAIPMYDNSNLNEESGAYLPADGNPAQASTNLDERPPVVINQNLAPLMDDPPQYANHYPASGREVGPPESQNPPSTRARAGQGTSNLVGNYSKPTIYLIAFKDHRIMQALGYWTEGTMLHYVTVEYAFNHASISLIDSDVSRHLNHERGIEFTLTGE
jgi:hypothetical protein